MSEHLEISASCTPTGSTGNILAINRGNTAVNITQLSVRNATGGLVFITSFRYGFVIYAGHNSTLASGFPYQGNNVTILAVSNRGNLFETMCPPIA